MRVLIIDDEAPAREVLADMLAAHPQVQIAGEADDVATALEQCRRHTPDALFLDIEMGSVNGFQLLEQLPFPQPAVVFVTAHEQFAVSAFKVCALDYLLKPVRADRLAETIEKIRRHLSIQPDARTIYLTTDQGIEGVEVQSITHIQADENYTSVFLKTGRTLHVRKSLQAWEALLPQQEFTRIHRSLLVNLAAITSISLESRDNGLLLLNGHRQPLRLARRALQRLRQLLTP